MKTLQMLAIPSALLATGLFVSNVAHGAEICSVILCANGCYTTVSKAIDLPENMNSTTESNACPDSDIEAATNGEYVGFKVPLGKAPSPVVLDCEKTGGEVMCEAWPQGESVTYSWSTTGSFVIEGSLGAANPVRGFSCTAGTQGTITVTAFSPSGASETVTQTVSCQ